MTSLTLITFAVMLYGAFSRNGYWRALAIGGGTPIGAALLFGDTAVPTFYMAAVGAAIGVVARLISRSRRFEQRREPLFGGAVPLLIFTGWAIVVTLVGQIFFVGMSVFLGPDPDSVSFISGQLSTSNIAQIGYLILGVAVVFFIAGSKDIGPGVIGVAATIVTLLSFWRFLSQNVGIPFPEGLFDNNSTYAFIETLPGGAPRFRGILSEPSGLAMSSLVTISYSVARAAAVTGWHRVGVLVVAVMAGIMAAISTSATFTVVAAVMLVLAGLAALHHVVIRRGGVQPLLALAFAGAAAASLWVIPLLVDLVSQTVNEKVGSSSYSDRSLSDTRSVGILFDSVGVGVGLGSNRGSSFVASLASTTGVIGVTLFAITLFILIRNALPLKEFRPVIWALTSVIVSKVVSSPDLADSSGILWLSLGVLAYAGIKARRQREALTPLSPEAARRLEIS